MSKIFVPQSLLDDLVCIQCKQYLSIFPIYTSFEQLGAICGRCHPEEDKFIRDNAYENFVKTLLFPCMYQTNGCLKSLTPALLANHESECEYNKFACVNKQCQWQGPKDKLFQHFQNDHAELVLRESNFKFNITKHFEEVMLLEHNSEIFQANIIFDEHKMMIHFFVKLLITKNKSSNYIYNLKLISGMESHNTKEYVTTEEEKFKQEALLNIFDKPNEVQVYIRIKHPFENQEDLNVSADLKDNPNIDWKMLPELECPVCYDFMVPPIYQCLGGHSICLFCKPNLSTCPTCRQGLQNTRNFVLEKISSKLNYPCKYYKQGCTFYSLSGDIRKHEESCIYGPLRCPMRNSGCTWYGNTCDFKSHVEVKHENILKSNNRIQLSLNDTTEKKSFIMYSGKVFVVIYKYVDLVFYCTVQLVGSDTNETFKFQLDVVDLSGQNMKCIMSREVKQVAGNENLNDYLCLMAQQLAGFTTDKIVFMVTVMKN